MRRGLPSPGRGADHAAEIAACEGGILIRENIGFHIAERRLRLVLDAVIEGLDDVFLEMRSTRMCMHHRLALRVAVLGILNPSTSISTPAVTRATTGCMCCGMPGVVCKAIAVQTVSISCCAMPWLRRKSRATFAPSTSKRSSALLC